MKLSSLHHLLLGEWSGENHLFLNWLPEPELISEGTMTVTPVGNGKFLSFAYTWKHEDKEQQGLLIVGNHNEKEEATAAWIDSWHQSGGVLQLKGGIDDSGEISVLGSFPAPPDPDWGWRISISANNDGSLRFRMFVIPAGGEEERAVEVEYGRR